MTGLIEQALFCWPPRHGGDTPELAAWSAGITPDVRHELEKACRLPLPPGAPHFLGRISVRGAGFVARTVVYESAMPTGKARVVSLTQFLVGFGEARFSDMLRIASAHMWHDGLPARGPALNALSESALRKQAANSTTRFNIADDLRARAVNFLSNTNNRLVIATDIPSNRLAALIALCEAVEDVGGDVGSAATDPRELISATSPGDEVTVLCMASAEALMLPSNPHVGILDLEDRSFRLAGAAPLTQPALPQSTIKPVPPPPNPGGMPTLIAPLNAPPPLLFQPPVPAPPSPAPRVSPLDVVAAVRAVIGNADEPRKILEACKDFVESAADQDMAVLELLAVAFGANAGSAAWRTFGALLQSYPTSAAFHDQTIRRNILAAAHNAKLDDMALAVRAGFIRLTDARGGSVHPMASEFAHAFIERVNAEGELVIGDRGENVRLALGIIGQSELSNTEYKTDAMRMLDMALCKRGTLPLRVLVRLVPREIALQRAAGNTDARIILDVINNTFAVGALIDTPLKAELLMGLLAAEFDLSAAEAANLLTSVLGKSGSKNGSLASLLEGKPELNSTWY